MAVSSGSDACWPGEYSRPVEKPIAPADMASSTRDRIVSSSAADGARVSNPMAASRTGPWATSGATFIDWPFANRASRYPAKDLQARSMPQSSSYPMVTTLVSSPSGAGAGPCPQFPITCVVRPWRTPLWVRPST